MNTQVLNEDINTFVKECTYWDRFKNKRIAITGATGLIGSILVKCLDALNAKYNLSMTIICIVRNIDKANAMFASLSSSCNIITIKDRWGGRKIGLCRSRCCSYCFSIFC